MKVFQTVEWKLRIMNLPYKFGELFGLDFNGSISTETLKTNAVECNAYTPANPAIKKVLKELHINKRDCILDMGCGKGKAMTYMLSFPFKKIDGLDISADLIYIAKKNFIKLRKGHKTCFYINNAKLFNEFDDYNYLFFYNPFPRSVMECVRNNILKSLKRFPRKMTIIYENPVDRDLFENGEFSWKEYKYDICLQPIVVYQYIAKSEADG